MTSGTTGIPKLAMMPHTSFADMARKWLESTPISLGDNWISITPTAWIVDQMWGMGVALAGGMAMNFPETPETATEDFREADEPWVAGIVPHARRVDVDDLLHMSQALFYFDELVYLLLVLGDHDGCPDPVEHGGQLFGHRRGEKIEGDRTEGLGAQLTEKPLRVVVRDDGAPLSPRQPQGGEP